jgi:RNA polymerase sigma factor (sigma-70 family)
LGSPTRVHASDERARWLAKNVLPHEPALRAWLLRRQVPGLEIDDIVQETYARLSIVASVDAIQNARTYMFQAAQSVILTYVRRARVVPMHSLALFESEEFVFDEPDPEEVAIGRDELTRLGRAIALLPPRMREVFLARRVEGLSQSEVAKKLGVSQSTVEKQMASGFRKLAEIMGRGGNRTGRASRTGSRGQEQENDSRDRKPD